MKFFRYKISVEQGKQNSSGEIDSTENNIEFCLEELTEYQHETLTALFASLIKDSKTKIDKAEERASEPLKTGVKKVAEVIDSGLLETLQNEIESQNRRLIIAFRSSEIDDVERARMVEEARKKICKFLREVMRFNEGNLPTKRLEMLWSSNSCDK